MIDSGLCLLTIMKGWMDHDRKWITFTDYNEGRVWDN